jgi:hypothetical protein
MLSDPTIFNQAIIDGLVAYDYDAIELLNFGIGVLALLLMAIALNAYRRTKLRRLLFVSAAFGLFVTKTALENVDVVLFELGPVTTQLLISLLDLGTLLLFFVALVSSH